MTDALIKLFYLLAAVLFIFGLKRLSSPATARSGNWLASLGMLIAIVVTLVFQEILGWREIIIGMAVGSLVGGIFARTVKMTGMPQMVALLNGCGGGAAELISTGPSRIFSKTRSSTAAGAAFGRCQYERQSSVTASF